MSPDESSQLYESLKKKEPLLNARYERICGRLESGRKQYQDLAAKVKESYGVSSLAEYEALLKKRHEANCLAMQEYKERAAKMEKELAEIEAALDGVNV